MSENNDQNLINRVEANINQCFESIEELITNYETIREQNESLIVENESLKERIESLKYEMQNLGKDIESYRSQLIQKDNEIDSLMAKLSERDALQQKAYDFARILLQNNISVGPLQSDPSVSVRPKTCQQNDISSTVNHKSNESLVTQSASPNPSNTSNETLTSNNLRIELIKVMTSRLIPVSVAFIETPSSFWLHINEDEVFSYIHVVQVKQKEMENNINYKLTSDDLKLGIYCAAIYSADGYWYRAQVIHINYENAIEKSSIKTVKVLFIDWGNVEELPLSKLMKLSNELTQRKQAIHCYLQGIASETIKWPQKSIEEFKNAVDKQKLSAVFHNRHKVDEELDIVIYPVDLIVTFESGETDNIENFLTRPETDDSPSVKDWDPMEEDALCDTNTYALIADDPATLTMGFRPQEKRTCKYYGTKGGCRKNECCPFLHVNPERRFAIDDEEDEPLSALDLDLEVDSYYWLKVTGIQSPFTFFGILPFGNKTFTESDFKKLSDNGLAKGFKEYQQLRDVCVELKKHYSNTKSKENPNVFHGIGSLVAYRDKKSDTYFRGRIVATDLELNTCTIFNLDLGHTVVVERNSVFKLKNIFTQFPTLAIHCSLFGVEPFNTSIWSEQSIQAFTEWTLDKCFCAHVRSSKFDNKVSIELIDYSNHEKKYISNKLIEYKFAQRIGNNVFLNHNQSDDDDIYSSDND